MSDHLDRVLDQDDERRDVRCRKCHEVVDGKLVERLAESERRCRLLEDELRQRVRREELYLAGHPDIAALMAENAELRQTIERLNAKVMRRRAS